MSFPILEYNIDCIDSQTYNNYSNQLKAYIPPIGLWDIKTVIFEALHHLYWFSLVYKV